jgi:EAL domain-containing protein (putative c-di-GMP-specific phosphodiesterase class I)
LQLRDPDFAGLVGEAEARLAEVDCGLVLEMTESIAVADNYDNAEAMRKLKRAGASLAIDEFGIGFSSIGYLQQLPVDIIKIDRSFTSDVDVNERAAALVEAILVMGAALDLNVVAEGIERESQALRLRQIGCKIGQGYLYGRPVTLTETLRALPGGVPASLDAVPSTAIG